jgi:DNA mismatch repair protein MutS2
MDKKALQTLEFPKVLARVAQHCTFSVAAEKALQIRPVIDLEDAHRLQAQTAEARQVLEEQPQFSVGGARDIRESVNNAARGQTLIASELLDVKSTLVAARSLQRRFKNEEESFPKLSKLSQQILVPDGVVDAITKSLSDRGELLDSASEKLGSIRSRLSVAHDRLLSRMQKLLASAQFGKHLQEAIVTQRDGRYVLPIKAESKSKVKVVVHDKSASGATLFVEPLQVVELNNEWRELQLAERDEERRILLALSEMVGEQAPDIQNAVEALATIDLVFARGRYAIELKANPPEILAMTPKKNALHPGLVLRLFGARHPLLDPESVVALDIELHPENYCLVITGPNTGGKTVTLKTVGLLVLMAQSGMHIPAEIGSQISLFKSIYADIGDEQSIEQSLSTFSGHITNIVQIMDQADQSSLLIFDELGAGTDPQEGAALANAILDHLVRRGISTLVATHYSELKAYAYGTPGVVNASVEFDLETLSPTYHLMVGLPGRSNALSIAERLGLRKDVIELARGTIDPTELQADDLLDEIHRERERSREARQRADEAQRTAEDKLTKLAERLESLEDERLEVLEEAREQAETELSELREEIGKLRGQLARARKPLEVVQKADKGLEELTKKTEKAIPRKTVPESAPSRALRLGDQVSVRSLQRSGIVTAIAETEAEVQVGALRVRARLGDIEILAEPAINEKDQQDFEPVRVTAPVSSPGGEISLRGQRAEEALDNLDNYLDSAYAAGLPSARVIHGKGTGKLREIVREQLKKRNFVERFESALPRDGGEGVTVAYFKDD